MSFRYTSPPLLTQGLSALVLIAGMLGALHHPAGATAYAAWVQGTPGILHVVGAFVALHLLVFWGMTGAFWLVDRFDGPAFITRHRIQSGPMRRPPAAKVARTLALNQLLLGPLLTLGLWQALLLLGWQASPTPAGPLEVLLDLAGLSVCSAVWFYASHRFLHRPWWMKRVHRVHHEFRTSRCVASEYAHPVEFIVGNYGTLGVGVLLLQPELSTLYIYTVVGTLTFVGHHSGYALPWMSWPVHHDWHHYRYTEIFGTFGLLDRLLGTDKEFRQLEDGQVVGGKSARRG